MARLYQAHSKLHSSDNVYHVDNACSTLRGLNAICVLETCRPAHICPWCVELQTGLKVQRPVAYTT